MQKPKKKRVSREFGAVAILDALSASTYTETEIEEFLRSRDRVLEELTAWVEEPHGSVKIQPQELETFTFNDTIVIVLRGGSAPLDFDKVTSFAAVIRKFIVDSMAAGLLFRGAAALGTFRVDTDTNTVMGDAVTDAAAWYAQAEWVGVHFTPRSFLELSEMYETSGSKRRCAMLNYDVPLHGDEKLNTFAINWPKILLVPSLSPWNNPLSPRAQLLRTLGQHRVPLGTEQKYLNTLAFFDHSLKIENQAKKEARPPAKKTKRRLRG